MLSFHTSMESLSVALLAEGVDRNIRRSLWSPNFSVALLAEGVDRNHLAPLGTLERVGVALLAEGVDRNSGCWLRQQRRRCRPPRGGRG